MEITRAPHLELGSLSSSPRGLLNFFIFFIFWVERDAGGLLIMRPLVPPLHLSPPARCSPLPLGDHLRRPTYHRPRGEGPPR